MNFLKKSVLVVYIILAISYLYTESSENLGELDAFNIELSKFKLLCQDADYPRWSPDGKKILYEYFSGSGYEIWKMNPDGSQKEFLVRGAHGNWSPDGQKIVFFSKKAEAWSNTFHLTIYDLRQKKVIYQDNKEFNLDALGTKNEIYDSHSVRWYENRIFVNKAQTWGGGVWILDDPIIFTFFLLPSQDETTSVGRALG